jgi:hypothetical protein
VSKPKTTSKTKKTIVIKMRKAHRILVLTMFSLLFLFMLAAMIYVITSSKFEIGIILMLFAIPTFLFLPFPVYYATWQITFDADGIQKRLLGINCKKRPWTQVKEVRSAWLVSERSYGISIIFKNRKTIHFRMDCENAEAAKKLILSHCSITEYRGMI